MDKFKHALLAASVLILPIMQGCVFAPISPDPLVHQATIERWNRCLARFETKQGHYCDGHRRDILAMYPAHLENQINELLSQDAQFTRASKLVNTALGLTATNAGNTARNTDL